jgi:DNA primase catalytic subunit
MFLLTPTMFFSFSYLYHNLQEQEMEETEWMRKKLIRDIGC